MESQPRDATPVRMDPEKCLKGAPINGVFARAVVDRRLVKDTVTWNKVLSRWWLY